MNTELAIRVEGLTKSFGPVDVLLGVNFSVDRGSIFALLGSNGAGKTTLVKIIATLLAADGGSAEVAGIDVFEHPADVREVMSLTGQFAAIDDILTGRENLLLIAKLRCQPDPVAIASGLLERFSLTDAADR